MILFSGLGTLVCVFQTKSDSQLLAVLNDYVCVFFMCRMLRSNKISCVNNASFTGLSSVRLLSLYDNLITSMSPGAFDTLHSLSTLWVSNHSIKKVFCFVSVKLSQTE